MKPEDFARQIKNKYPQYQNVNDIELARSIIQKYPQYSNQVDFTLSSDPKRESIIGETLGDVKETFGGIKSSIEERMQKTEGISNAQKSGKQGFLRSSFQKFGQGTGAVSDVIGESVLGAGKVLLPQKAEDAISKVATGAFGSILQFPKIQSMMQSFEQLKQTDPEKARDIDALLGIGTLALDIATAGVGGQTVKQTTKAGIAGAEATAKGALKVGSGARRIGFELEGALTGTSQETLEMAFQSAKQGGKQFDSFTSSLRGKVTPEAIVENVRGAISEVRSSNSKAYRDAITPIVSEVVDTSKVSPGFTKKLSDFGISIKEGELDFSNSKFRTVPQAQTKIQQTYNEVVGLGENTTLGNVDTTRQALRELIMTGDDASARSANSIIEEAITSVRDSGRQVDGYGEMLSNFAENAEFLDELTRSLSTGDKTTIDTAYRKLATSLKTNNERRMNLLKELDSITDGAVLGTIAGQQLSETLPRGLFRQIGAGLAGAGIITGGISTSLLVPMVFASPRIAGEVIRALGLSAKKTKIILDSISDVKKTVDKLNLSLPMASPLMQTTSQETQTQ
jgi:hypothetical protein